MENIIMLRNIFLPVQNGKQITLLMSGAVCNLASQAVFGAAFMLNEQNISGLGNAYAGRTAIAEDASTSFFNPAGLVLINNHKVVGSLAGPLAKFEMSPKAITRATLEFKNDLIGDQQIQTIAAIQMGSLVVHREGALYLERDVVQS